MSGSYVSDWVRAVSSMGPSFHFTILEASLKLKIKSKTAEAKNNPLSLFHGDQLIEVTAK